MPLRSGGRDLFGPSPGQWKVQPGGTEIVGRIHFFTKVARCGSVLEIAPQCVFACRQQDDGCVVIKQKLQPLDPENVRDKRAGRGVNEAVASRGDASQTHGRGDEFVHFLDN